MLRTKSRRTNFLEDLGLVLNICPTYVKSLYAKCYPEVLGATHMPVFVEKHAMVGHRLATTTCCHIYEGSKDIPIVLIADTTDSTLDRRLYGSQVDSPPPNIFEFDIYFYGNLLMGIIERDDVFSNSADNLIFNLIVPALHAVLHMDAHKLRSWCDYTPPSGQTCRIENSVGLD